MRTWITIEEAFALRGERLVRALWGGTIQAEGCRSRARENSANWVIMPSVIWQRDAFFVGEPGFPLLYGHRVQGMVYAIQGGEWWEVRVSRAEVEALPMSPELVQRAVRDWLCRRARESQSPLKQKVEFPDCKAATGCTWRQYLLVFRQLPSECRNTRGQH